MVDKLRDPAVAGLRIDLDPPVLELGESGEVSFTARVRNQSDVIETVDLAVTGMDIGRLVTDVTDIQLMPGEVVAVTVTMSPATTPDAGLHKLTVEAHGTSGVNAVSVASLTLDVAPFPDIELAAEPPLRIGGRRTTFAVAVRNTGNTPLVAQLRPHDDDQALKLDFDRPVMTLAPGASRVSVLRVRGRRPWLGNVAERAITVDLTAGLLERTAQTRFRQKPRLSAGVITVLTLLLVGVLWALAMLFGVSTALSPADPTKVLPASFSAVENEDGVGGGISLADLDPTIISGSIAGQVVAVSTGRPAGRITVEAFDPQGRAVGATATDDDGAFTLESLLPTRYRLRIQGPGFEQQWWPGAATAEGAEVIPVSPSAPQEDIVVRLLGTPAAIGGVVVAGDGGEAIPVSVSLEALDVVEGTSAGKGTTDEDGNWSIGGLTAPATYRIRLEAPGYQAVEITQPVDAGAQVNLNTVRLPAAGGSIAGRIVDRSGVALGGVTIDATRLGVTVTTVTPTAGDVGAFLLTGLETPGTYLLTLTSEGRSSVTTAVRLEAGQSLTDLEIELVSTTGEITGTATDPSGTGLGGVTVTIRGAGITLTTETLTSGDVGRYRLTGVPLPGSYTVTFEMEGRRPQTVRAELTRAAPRAEASAPLPPAEGRVTGKVIDADGKPLPGSQITVSDGATEVTTTTASSPEERSGEFVVDGLAPGSYTITVVAPDGTQKTVLIQVEAGATVPVTVRMGDSP